MTLKEFDCWLSGFMEGRTSPPSEDDWKRIRSKIRDELKPATIDLSQLPSTTILGGPIA